MFSIYKIVIYGVSAYRLYIVPDPVDTDFL